MTTLYKALRTASVVALSLGAVQLAHAGPIDSMLVGGINTIEDRSGEIVFECDPSLTAGSQCTQRDIGDTVRLTPDPVTGVFDIFVGVLDFENINGVAVGANRQLTGLFAVKFDGTTGLGGSVVINEPVGPDIFEEIFGIDLTTDVPLDEGSADDVLAVFFQHNDRVAQGELSDTTDDDFDNAVDAAKLGDLAAVVGLVEDDDFFDAQILNANAGIVGGGTAGDQTQLFNLAFGLSFQHFGFTGEFVPGAIAVDRLRDGVQIFADVGGTGSNTKAAGQEVDTDVFHIGNDIQAQFQRIPEPGTLGLLGLGLLAAGAAARRSRAA